MIRLAEIVRAESDMNYNKRTAKWLPKILKTAESEINYQSRKGKYIAQIDYCYGEYTDTSFILAKEELEKLGYKVNIRTFRGITSLDISWGDSP